MDTKIEGNVYHYEVCGEGYPLLLLHGFTGDSTTWSPFCEQLGGKSRLIIPDIIGHGKTEISDLLSRYQIESAAKDLDALLDAMEIQKTDVLGYSMGGRLALTFAILYPERVRRLILESASPGLITDAERKERRLKDGELAHFIKEKGIPAFVDYWESLPLFSTMNAMPPDVRATIRKQRLANSPKGLANSLLGMGTGSQPSWWGTLEKIDCEVLLITGRLDEKFCGIAKQMQNLLRKSSWVAVENCGHAIHVEEKEKFGTIVGEFLANTE